MTYPPFGTRPIRCSKRGCKWTGYETDLTSVMKSGSAETRHVCPFCKCDSYYFMTEKEIAKWKGRPAPKETPFQFCIRTAKTHEEADATLAVEARRLIEDRLAEQRAKGYGGWWTCECTDDDLRARLLKNYNSGDMLDVAVLAMMLHVRQRYGLGAIGVLQDEGAQS